MSKKIGTNIRQKINSPKLIENILTIDPIVHQNHINSYENEIDELLLFVLMFYHTYIFCWDCSPQKTNSEFFKNVQWKQVLYCFFIKTTWTGLGELFVKSWNSFFSLKHVVSIGSKIWRQIWILCSSTCFLLSCWLRWLASNNKGPVLVFSKTNSKMCCLHRDYNCKVVISKSIKRHNYYDLYSFCNFVCH